MDFDFGTRIKNKNIEYDGIDIQCYGKVCNVVKTTNKFIEQLCRVNFEINNNIILHSPVDNTLHVVLLRSNYDIDNLLRKLTNIHNNHYHMDFQMIDFMGTENDRT